MSRDSRLIPVRDSAIAWVVEKVAVTGALGGGGLQAFLAWNQPISWSEYVMRVAITAAALGLAGFAIGNVLDRRRPLRLVFGSGGLFFEETFVEHGLMRFGSRRLYRIGLLNRYTKTVDDVAVRLVSREPGQGADMGRRFREKDTGDFRFAVERGSGPARYVDFVIHETGGELSDHFIWLYEVPVGYSNMTPVQPYVVTLEVTGRDVREQQIRLCLELDRRGELVVTQVDSSRLMDRIDDPWLIGIAVELLLFVGLFLWWRLS